MAQRARGVRAGAKATPGGAVVRVVGPFGLIAEKLLIVATITSAAALIYLLYGLASAHITAFPKPPSGTTSLSEAAQAALIQWVTTATKILAWGALIAALLALVRYYQGWGAIVAAGAIGGFLYAGLPAMIAMMLQQSYRAPNALTNVIILGAQAAGKTALVIAATRGAVQVFLSVVRRSKRVRVVRTPAGPGKVTVRAPSLLSRCWELAHCRAPSGACPRFRQGKSCWKVGSGCACDFTVAERIAQGSQAWTNEEVAAVRQRGGPGRARCRSCSIYEEHQGYKFRLLQWLVYPATVGLIFLLRTPLHVGYQRTVDFLDQAVAMLSFMPQPAANPLTGSGGVQSIVLSSNVEWVFIGCLWLLLVSYVLQAAEHVTFRWGW